MQEEVIKLGGRYFHKDQNGNMTYLPAKFVKSKYTTTKKKTTVKPVWEDTNTSNLIKHPKDKSLAYQVARIEDKNKQTKKGNMITIRQVALEDGKPKMTKKGNISIPRAIMIENNKTTIQELIKSLEQMIED